MSASIQAPPYTNSLEFTGYDGVAMDICDKMTSLMGLHEKIRLILDSYVDPKTMKYKMEAIYPGLLPPGSIMAYHPKATDASGMRREVWQLQRTPDDLEGVNLAVDAELRKNAIWTVCDGEPAGGGTSRDLRGRFIVSYLDLADETIVGGGLKSKDINSVGGTETTVLTPAQGGFVNHTHLLGFYGLSSEVPDSEEADLTVHKIDPSVLANGAIGWVVDSATNAENNDGPVMNYNTRTSGVHEPAGVPGPIYDTAPGRTEAVVMEGHNNLPPYRVMVYIQRTPRMDINTTAA